MATPSLPVTLVTGAGRGLGRGIALRLAALGHSVAINYASNEAAAQETAELCRQAASFDSQQFLAIQADVGAPAGRQKLLASTLETFGRIDALVNNAGMGPKIRTDILDASEVSFEEVLRTNLQGPYFLTQLIARYWLSAKPVPLLPHGFKVVFVSSISADTASLNRGEYCVSKAGLAMAAQLWATRLAAESIQVFELRPGIMATDMTAGAKQKYDALLAQGLVPQARWGTPEDVGLAVSALLSGDFPFSTGAVIPIDGGLHLRRL
ncbi:3-ketoacyl-ACP reductase [Opitutaceae bacterium EW11]|nr:3-ketoacyl-ACP reductase [Opitutaceae bacterium EW11]